MPSDSLLRGVPWVGRTYGGMSTVSVSLALWTADRVVFVPHAEQDSAQVLVRIVYRRILVTSLFKEQRILSGRDR